MPASAPLTASSLRPSKLVVVGERDEGAAGMGDTDEGAVGDEVQRLQTVIGMRAPADIGKQAASLAVAVLLARLRDSEERHHAAGPFGKLAGVLGRKRARKMASSPAAASSGSLNPLPVGQQRIEIALAHTLGGEEYPRGLHDGDRLLQSDGAEGQKVAATFGDGRHKAESFWSLAVTISVQEIHGVGKAEFASPGSCAADSSLPHLHMQRADSAPGAADGMKAQPRLS